MTDNRLTLVDAGDAATDQLDEHGHPEVGQWFWIMHNKYDAEQEGEPAWLGCVVHIGTNYIKLEGIRYSNRIHFDTFLAVCKRELDPDAYIDGRIAYYTNRTARLMGRVRELTARLGVAPSRELTSGDETRALATIGQGQDVGDYKASLVKAKDKQLPDLFEKIKKSNDKMAEWMTAKTIPLEAEASSLKDVIETSTVGSGWCSHAERRTNGKTTLREPVSPHQLGESNFEAHELPDAFVSCSLETASKSIVRVVMRYDVDSNSVILRCNEGRLVILPEDGNNVRVHVANDFDEIKI